MQHPFGGILPGSEKEGWDRRHLLQVAAWGLGAGASLWPQLPLWAQQRSPGAKSWAAYVVVPRDLRRFGPGRRQQLGVWGPYFPLAQPQGPPQAGFLAWLEPAQAQKLATQPEVAQVVRLTEKLKPDPGPRPRGVPLLLVELVPNSFRRAPEGTYLPTQKVLQQWEEQLSSWVRRGLELQQWEQRPGFVVIRLPMGMGLQEVLQVIKSHPQTARVRWFQPQPTTLALGEEGGPVPTTRRLGEEGGVTTFALGEEGAPPPLKNPQPEQGRGPQFLPPPIRDPGQVTTLAFGEEGGRVIPPSG